MKQRIYRLPNMRAATANMPDWIFILWAGGTALLSYSLVYALRKPFTAAEFDGLQVAGMDYKIVVSIIQLIGYVCAKMLGIKYISELKPEGRLRFIIRFGGVVRAFARSLRPSACALQHLRPVLQRPFAGMHVGSDIQFP